MSQRAIDRFRPQPASRPQTHAQGHPHPSSDSPASATSPAAESVVPEAIEANPPSPLPSSVELDQSAPAQAAALAEEALPEPLAASTSATPAPVPPRRVGLTHARRQLLRGMKRLGVPLVWIGVAAFCGGTGYAAFNWLSTNPPVPECDRLWLFSPDADKLFCAEQAVQLGKQNALQAGIKLVGQWDANHRLYPKASRLYREWSKRLLQSATQRALEYDINGAIELASTIKPENPVYREAKNAILEWEKLRDRDHLLTNTFEAALKAQDWKKAELELQPRSNQVSDYQRQRLNRLRERMVMERIAVNQLQQIRELVKAKPADVQTLGRAIQLVAQINSNSYVSEAASRDRQQWHNTLIEMVRSRLVNGDTNGAIAAAQWLTIDPSLPSDLQELVWVSRSQQPPSHTPGNVPPLPYLWQQTTTLAVLRQIQPASPVYPVAQSQQAQLERQVQDLNQLSLASAVARVPYIPTLQVAIQMAQSISLERPHRLEAQTLIAEWRREIQRVQDRPMLLQARRLAKSGKIKDLQAAIAQASKIPLGRALRPNAQAAIFDWQQQIQTIEDQPILNEARQLAKQQQLAKAIASASKIGTGRALYPEAQEAIRAWTTTIQTAEDRPILDEAIAVAAQRNWDTAINIAAQIAPGRALYNEAQTAIAQWSAQLTTTRRSRRYDDRYDDRNRYEERNRYEDDSRYGDRAPQ